MTDEQEPEVRSPEDIKKGLGLVGKFEVKRVWPSSRGIDHGECQYFVLDPLHDPLAFQALEFYAELARGAGYTKLYEDLLEWMDQIDIGGEDDEDDFVRPSKSGAEWGTEEGR